MRVVHDAEGLAGSAGGVFVPTMGALHEGHLALVARGRTLGSPLVVSIFVNPTQFGPGEDLDGYPRTLEADLAAAESMGVDVVFAPPQEAIYPRDAEIAVPPLPAVATGPRLEDACRPGHLAGVCQVVARLFDLVRPAVAVFGEKDYQQLLVVRALAEAGGDRWPGLRIEACPTVREPGGLALSSRNAYLSADQRDRALGLSRALHVARCSFAMSGDAGTAETRMREVLEAHGVKIDYAAIRDARTLERLASRDDPARGLVAGRVGDVRLIDNMAMG